MPLDSFLSGPELSLAISYSSLYTIFKQYGKLGIQISHNDIDIDTLQVLSEFENAAESVINKKSSAKSRKR